MTVTEASKATARQQDVHPGSPRRRGGPGVEADPRARRYDWGAPSSGTRRVHGDKGTLTSYGLDAPPCDPVGFPAGKALSAGPHSHHAHLVRNLGTEPLEVTVLHFNLAAGEPGAVTADRPAECPTTLN